MLFERLLVGKMERIQYSKWVAREQRYRWRAPFVGLCLCLLAALSNSGEARAGTVTGSLPVQMQITAACTVNTSSLTFTTTSGTSLTSSQVTQTGTISVTCTNSSPYSIGLDNGQNASSGQRRMANSTNYISYNVYLDSAHTEPWTTAATSSTCTGTNTCYLGTGDGSAQTVDVYGVVPTVTAAPASGTYSDSITITVTY
jgi:spore coat protein U-like protein